MQLDWQKIASVDFEVDGALRDIYITGTTDADWNKVLEDIRKFVPGLMYKEDHEPVEMPQRVEAIFERRKKVTASLCFKVGKFQINCHFFCSGIIEFDLDPREMTCPDDLEAIAEFLRLLADTTKKRVLLTPENYMESPILQCSPDTGQVTWMPPKN